MSEFLNYIINGILVGQIYALVAMSFVVIYRSSKVMNLSQGEIVLVSGLIVFTVANSLPGPAWLAFLVAVPVGATFGLLIERVFFSRLVGQSILSMVMVTLGILILLRGLVLIVWGAQERYFPALLPSRPLIFGDFIIPIPLLAAGVCSVAAAIGLSWFFNRTRAGLALSAVSENHEIAQSLGISIRRSMAIAWALGGGLAIVSASIYLSGKTVTMQTSDIGFAALPLALLAGLESVGGLLLAGAIIGVAQGLTAAYVDPVIGSHAATVVPYFFMIAILLIRPTGLFGWSRIERV